MVESSAGLRAESTDTGVEGTGARFDDAGEDAADLLVEEISIDGMCGVY